MECIDLTLDLEKMSMSANAAILQIIVVAWDRSADSELIIPDFPPFIGHVDLRSCVAAGFEIDPQTSAWWSIQPQGVKDNVLYGPAYPLHEVLKSFATWVEDLKEAYSAHHINIWSWHADQELPILQNAFRRYGMKFPFTSRDVRDARTFILENSDKTACDDRTIERICSNIPFPDDEAAAERNLCAKARWKSSLVWTILKSGKEKR